MMERSVNNEARRWTTPCCDVALPVTEEGEYPCPGCGVAVMCILEDDDRSLCEIVGEIAA